MCCLWCCSPLSLSLSLSLSLPLYMYLSHCVCVCVGCSFAMKSGRVRVMNGRGQEVGIDLDPNLTAEGSLPHGVHPPTAFTPGIHNNSRSHSRSQSWSFNSRGQRPSTNDLTTSLAALNPITSVIREIVPSFGQEESDTSSGNSPTLMSRAASQVSLPLTGGIRFGEGLGREPPNLPHPPRPHRTGGGGRGAEGGGERGAGNGNDEQQQNIGFEISDGIRWLEHNAIFIILLLLKFAWYHRSGNPAPPLSLPPLSLPPLSLPPLFLTHTYIHTHTSEIWVNKL